MRGFCSLKVKTKLRWTNYEPVVVTISNSFLVVTPPALSDVSSAVSAAASRPASAAVSASKALDNVLVVVPSHCNYINIHIILN